MISGQTHLWSHIRSKGTCVICGYESTSPSLLRIRSFGRQSVRISPIFTKVSLLPSPCLSSFERALRWSRSSRVLIRKKHPRERETKSESERERERESLSVQCLFVMIFIENVRVKRLSAIIYLIMITVWPRGAHLLEVIKHISGIFLFQKFVLYFVFFIQLSIFWKFLSSKAGARILKFLPWHFRPGRAACRFDG